MTISSAGNAVHQTSIRNRALQAHVGTKRGLGRERNLVNVSPQTKQVSTLTVGTATGGAAYVFTFNGVEYTYTEPAGSPSTSDVAANIAEFMQNLGAIYGAADITVASAVITLTGKIPGLTFTLSDSDAKITSATPTAADDADPVGFGLAVMETGLASTNESSPDDTAELGALVVSANLTGQIDLFTTADPGTGQRFTLNIQILGLPEVVSVTAVWATDLDTTLDNLAVLANAALTDLGYNVYVVVGGPSGDDADAGQIAVLAAVEGVEFMTTLTCDDVAGYPVITRATNLAHDTSLVRSFAGAALRTSDHEAPYSPGTDSSTEWGPNEEMLIREQGDVWVTMPSGGVTFGDQVFVDVSDGSFKKAVSATAIPLPRSRAMWVRSGRTGDGDTLALLRLK